MTEASVIAENPVLKKDSAQVGIWEPVVQIEVIPKPNNRVNWGFKGKTVFEVFEVIGIPMAAILVSVILAGYDSFRETSREKAKQHREDKRLEKKDQLALEERNSRILQDYYSNISALMDKGLGVAKPNLCSRATKICELTPEDRQRVEMASSYTIAALSLLDSVRNASLLQFVQRLGFVDKDKKLIEFERAYLEKANLRGANLRGANLEGASLRRADLRGANLETASLNRADLRVADLLRADLTKAYLSGAYLTGAYMTRAKLNGAYLTRARLNGAHLMRAKLVEADLQEANLQGANLQGANLQGANLQGANLRGANLQGAKNLTCDQLAQALNWKLAVRDDKHRCGAEGELPKPKLD